MSLSLQALQIWRLNECLRFIKKWAKKNFLTDNFNLCGLYINLVFVFSQMDPAWGNHNFYHKNVHFLYES